jgi:glycosyltransferase involved in cell wall biosynthesis
MDTSGKDGMLFGQREEMTHTPDVSVVMSVYNGAAHLRKSVDSILSQDGVKLELIVVNDGSADESGKILDEYANHDCRVRVIHQNNQGLTRALIAGCASAKGKYIARQDLGDISISGRLLKQFNCIEHSVDCAFVSCGTRFVGPKGEHLYDVNDEAADAMASLLTLELRNIRGPSSHGSALFSRACYERVGGYRAEFYFAQDLDLWIRLAEGWKHTALPEVLYQSSLDVGSISGVYRKEQIATARVILECARLRRESLEEAPALRRAALIRPGSKRTTDRLQRARALYFIGVCLNRRGDPQARNYFRQALHAFPFHFKSAARLMLGYRI